MIIIYIGKLCYTHIIKLGKYIQNISVATDERPSFMLALVRMEVEEIKKVSCECDLNSATLVT